MNRLQHETSPYLLQHAQNPVDWYPWGAEALAKAQAEDKPILLSVGYSACHWCHVMAHESFEDPATAAMMNRLFVNIKVDREERPDLDDIYMQATQIIQQGHGGWPMTVFLTPDARPFHAGTYYPPTPRHGMPSFQQVMQAVYDTYQNRRADLERSADQIAHMLQSRPLAADGEISPALLAAAAQAMIANADTLHGGLHRGAPKFPSPMNLDFLLRSYTQTRDERVLQTILLTLEKMARGGIYDQLGGGFHRYSVDEEWLVPHFEKMLYDNAQLARVYLHAYQITGDAFLGAVCQQILAYVEREMLDPNGGFYSTQDADSEGEEGKFFVWTPDEIRAVLGDTFDTNTTNALLHYWDITPGGNFEGKNILHCDAWAEDLAHQYQLSGAVLLAAIEKARALLFAAREGRIKPARDEKMLAAWNGMMLAAFAEAARGFPAQRHHYTQIAQQGGEFVRAALLTPDGRLYRSPAAGVGYLEDYAHIIDALLELYQTTFDPAWFQEAQRLADEVLLHFRSEDGGAFYDTSDTHESLIARPRSLQDNATPSGNSQMAYNLLRLSAYTGRAAYEDAALLVLRQLVVAARQYPAAFGMALSAMQLVAHPPQEVAIIGDPTAPQTQAVLDAVQGVFRPSVVVALAAADQGADASPPLLAHRGTHGTAPTVYVCRNFSCAAPVNTAAATAALLA